MTGYTLTAARQSMAVRHHRDAIQLSGGVAFDEGKLTRVKRASRLVAKHSRWFAIDLVGTCQLARYDSATTAGCVAQADWITHSVVTPLFGEP